MNHPDTDTTFDRLGKIDDNYLPWRPTLHQPPGRWASVAPPSTTVAALEDAALPDVLDRMQTGRIVDEQGTTTHVMCCSCGRFVPVADLWHDQTGRAWDLCSRRCATSKDADR